MPPLISPRNDPAGQSLTARPMFRGAAPSVDIPPPENMPPWLMAMINALGRGGPYAAGAGLMGKTIEPQPAQAPGAPTNLPMQRPSYAGPLAPPAPPAPPAAVGPSMPPGSPMPAVAAPIPPSRPPVAAAPPAARPIPPSMVDLGFYRPSVGNAQTPTFVPQSQTQAPPIYRGPMTTGGNRTPYYG